MQVCLTGGVGVGVGKCKRWGEIKRDGDFFPFRSGEAGNGR